MLALFRLAAEVGTAANWVIVFISAIIAVFVVFIGIAMYAVFSGSTAAHRPALPIWQFASSECAKPDSATHGFAPP
jgi:hypothetical protein